LVKDVVVRVQSSSDVERLVDANTPEARTLEFKRALTLSTSEARSEFLKDVSGMANAGGGSIVLGIGEDGQSRASEIIPLLDTHLSGQMEDLIRTGIQPSLIFELREIEVAGGFVIVLDVERSAIGPNRVEYGSSSRYFKRGQTHVQEMTEQEIRDAYALALRQAEQLSASWSRHGFPPRNSSELPSLSIGTVPVGPSFDEFSPRQVDLVTLSPSPALRAYVAFNAVDLNLGRWDTWHDGLRWEIAGGGDLVTGPGSSIRESVCLYRDGGAVVGAPVRTNQVYLLSIARLANALLAYLGFIYGVVDVRQPLEIRMRLDNLVGTSLMMPNPNAFPRTFALPAGVNEGVVLSTSEVKPQDLQRSSVRHRIVWDLVDRLAHGYGRRGEDFGFRCGWLHGADGAALMTTIMGDQIYDYARNHQVARIGEDGRVVGTSHNSTFGWLSGGALLALDGSTVAVTEFATGAGCPDSFLQTTRRGDGASDPTSTSEVSRRVSIDCPGPTGLWSPTSLAQLVQTDLEVPL
jgi:hypothetical protein